MKSKKDRLKKKAWIVFSKWIRERDKRCVTCSTGLAENAGHFWHNILDFDEVNINGQCVRCNKWLSGNLAVYAEYLIKRYGLKKFNKLSARHYIAMKGEHYEIEDYEKIIKKYEI